MARIAPRDAAPTVAIIPWGLSFEDFLEPNGLTLDTFCAEFRGAWMFPYAEALRSAGVRAVHVCFSRTVRDPVWRVHAPSDTPLLVFPVSRFYRAVRRLMTNPYGRTSRQTFGRRGVLAWPVLAPLREVAPYTATPLRPLLRELRRADVRAILCQEYEFPRFDVLAAASKLGGIPIFGVFQGGDYRRWRMERLTRPLAVRACAGLIIGAAAERDRVRALYSPPDAKMAAIGNPVDVDVWRPADQERARAELGLADGVRVVVWHGRVQLPKKGLDILLQAWISICRELDPRTLRLVLVGDGEQAAEMCAAIDESGLENVVFANRLVHDPAELRKYLAAGDVYAFPSRHEGFPVAPIEAMACGLPVVAADAGGMRDILGESELAGGVVVPREDAAALARALRDLLDDDSLRRTLGDRARRRAVRELSLEAVGRKLRAFLFDGEGGSVA